MPIRDSCLPYQWVESVQTHRWHQNCQRRVIELFCLGRSLPNLPVAGTIELDQEASPEMPRKQDLAGNSIGNCCSFPANKSASRRLLLCRKRTMGGCDIQEVRDERLRFIPYVRKPQASSPTDAYGGSPVAMT